MRKAVCLILFLFCFAGFVMQETAALPFNTDMLEVQPGPDVVARSGPQGSVAVGSLKRQKPELTTDWVQKNPLAGNSASIERGKRKYQTNCTPCHGNFANGRHEPSSLLAKGMPSIDLSSEAVRFNDPGTNNNPKTDAHFFTYIFNGGVLMPAYGYKMSNDDVWDLVSYIRFVQNAASGQGVK